MPDLRALVLGSSLLAALAACGPPEAPIEYEPAEPGVSAEPKWITFTCVRPGCTQTESSTVSVVGPRDIAIRRIILSDEDNPDFTITPKREPPFILAANETLPIDVRHAPSGDPRLEDPYIRVTYTDASAREGETGRVEPGELQIPLVRRLIGEARLAVEPEMLDFGAVVPGARSTATLRIRNVGFGNVGLVLSEIVADPPEEIQLGALPPSLGPGESVEIDVTWSPTTESFLRGTLNLRPVGQSGLPTVVPMLGTSIRGASVDIEPARGVDFGAVAVGQSATAMLQITNRGTQDLLLRRVRLTNVPAAADMRLEWPAGSLTSTIPALRSTTAIVHLTANASARLDARVEILSNERGMNTREVPVTGLLAKPTVAAAPASVDYGAVPRGWTRTLPIEVSNAGYGELVVQNVSLVLGSSELFTLRTVPTLPARLSHDERLALELEFRSEAAASFSGTLAIETNDPDTPFLEIPLAARGATCEEGCPIANGSPDCSAGMCAVGACDRGWYDADADPVNGCECREPAPQGDPGSFCADAIYLGSIDDDGESVSFTGVIPEAGDVDVIRFHARDSSQFLRDDFDVRLSLSSNDPGIQMCVYRHDTENHINECVLENRRCGVRSYRRDGNFGREDGADFVVEVSRTMSSAPSCTTYTIFARNG